MTCEKLQSCKFLENMSNEVPYTISMVKLTYCEFNNSNCARYKMSKLLDDLEMPADLWPSDAMKVLELMEIKFRERQKDICTADLIPGRTS